MNISLHPTLDWEIITFTAALVRFPVLTVQDSCRLHSLLFDRHICRPMLVEWKCACGVRFTGVDGDVLCNNVVAEMTCSGKWSALVDCRCHTGTMNAQDACATMEEHINKFAKHMVLLKMSLDVCHVIQNAQAVLKACMVE